MTSVVKGPLIGGRKMQHYNSHDLCTVFAGHYQSSDRFNNGLITGQKQRSDGEIHRALYNGARDMSVTAPPTDLDLYAAAQSYTNGSAAPPTDQSTGIPPAQKSSPATSWMKYPTGEDLASPDQVENRDYGWRSTSALQSLYEQFGSQKPPTANQSWLSSPNVGLGGASGGEEQSQTTSWHRNPSARQKETGPSLDQQWSGYPQYETQSSVSQQQEEQATFPGKPWQRCTGYQNHQQQQQQQTTQPPHTSPSQDGTAASEWPLRNLLTRPPFFSSQQPQQRGNWPSDSPQQQAAATDNQIVYQSRSTGNWHQPKLADSQEAFSTFANVAQTDKVDVAQPQPQGFTSTSSSSSMEAPGEPPVLVPAVSSNSDAPVSSNKEAAAEEERSRDDVAEQNKDETQDSAYTDISECDSQRSIKQQASFASSQENDRGDTVGEADEDSPLQTPPPPDLMRQESFEHHAAETKSNRPVSPATRNLENSSSGDSTDQRGADPSQNQQEPSTSSRFPAVSQGSQPQRLDSVNTSSTSSPPPPSLTEDQPNNPSSTSVSPHTPVDNFPYPPRSISSGSSEDGTSPHGRYISDFSPDQMSPRSMMFPGMGVFPGMMRNPDDKRPDVFYCHLCSYVGKSQFHFNAHMNSHFEHACPHCDYTSRTEGRLKRHIKDFHSDNPPDNFSGNRTMRQPSRSKIYKCKQCDFVSQTKVEFWDHTKSHIKDDKVLQCPKCPFVTEYKHHLEYHLRNHFGSKPFKCTKCNYACVNKSMLNSHMKSHTNVYQYRCADCTYATKYCHSLKLHLKKYQHKPATVLNADGSLPVDGSGDFELVSKRGPPRGPRGPRSIHGTPHRSPNPGSAGLSPEMMLPQALLSSPGALNGGLGGAGGPFWPLIANQLMGGMRCPPPPLLPFPGFNPLLLGESPRKEMESQPMLPKTKCQFCNFEADSPQAFTMHMMKVHAAENRDILSMFGIQSEALEAAISPRKPSPPATSRDSSSARSTPRSAPNTPMVVVKQEPGVPLSPHNGMAGSDGAWPTDGFPSPGLHGSASNLNMHMMRDQNKRHLVEDMAANIRKEAQQNGECPLDLTNAKGEQGSDASSTGSSAAPSPNGSLKRPMSADPENSNSAVEPTPRKRSRKGKAYKLDTLCLKLQQRYTDSPNASNDESGAEDDYISDYGGEKGEQEGENGVENGEKAPSTEGSTTKGDQAGIDYNEIHNSLRELNNGVDSGTQSGCAGNSVGSSHGSSSIQNEAVASNQVSASQVNIAAIPPSIAARRQLFFAQKERLALASGALVKEGDDVVQESEVSGTQSSKAKQNMSGQQFECNFCEIAFRDCVMYTMHMGYHGYSDPFKCNMCGQQNANKVEFFLHIARVAHE